MRSHQRIHAQTMVTFVFREHTVTVAPAHPCSSHGDVGVPRAYGHTSASMLKPWWRSCSKSIRSPQRIHAQTMVTFVFQEHTVTAAHPCSNHGDVRVPRAYGCTSASMLKPWWRSCSKSIRSPQRIHAQPMVTFVFQEHTVTAAHPCSNHGDARVPRAYGYQSIHAQTVVTFAFQEKTVTRAFMPIPEPASLHCRLVTSAKNMAQIDLAFCRPKAHALMIYFGCKALQETIRLVRLHRTC